MKIKSINQLLFTSSLIIWTGVHIAAQTDVFIKVHPTGFRPLLLIVQEFSSPQNTELAVQLRQIVCADLNFSGFVRVIENKDSSNGLFNNSSANAEIVVEGLLQAEAGRLRFNLSVKESKTARKVFSKTYQISDAELRYLAHTASDEIIYRLCGDNGVACTKIAFVTKASGAKELAMIDYDGWNWTQLTHNKSLNFSPHWAPDGLRLIFSSYAWSDPEIVTFSLKDFKSRRTFDVKGFYSTPAYAPNGKRMAFTMAQEGNSDIYAANADGNNIRRLTYNSAIDTAPCWSPTGREIAFTSDRSGSPQIYIMDSDGGNVRRLTFENSYNSSADWSPKGDVIAFVSQESCGFQIYLIDSNGENQRRITDGLASYENPSWAPDGIHIVCASNRNNGWDLYMLSWDGSNLQRLTNSEKNTMPVWSPRLKLIK